MDSKVYLSRQEEVFGLLESGPEGLSSEEAQRRLQRYGRNVLEKRGGVPLWRKFLANFVHFFAIMLWVAAVLSWIGDMPELAIACVAVIVINGIFTFWQEFKAEKAIESLQKILPKRARVVRDGQERDIDAEELVPGDLVVYEAGNSVSADARLIEVREMSVNNSALTGESEPQRRIADALDSEKAVLADLPNLVFAGTTVTAGSGRGVVYASGMDTELGKIAGYTQEIKEEPSPLQRQIGKIVKILSVIAVSLGVLFFLLGAFVMKMGRAGSFMFAIGIIVANVPEGLLPTVTLALAMGTQRMAKRHALIKKLSSVETLGCTTVICTDKTGTLTRNQMTVRRLVVDGRRLRVTGSGYAPQGEFLAEDGSPCPEGAAGLQRLAQVAVLCNDAALVEEDGVWQVTGDPTEGALLVLGRKAGLEPRELLEEFPRVAEIPFSSERRRMSTIHRAPEGYLMCLKGAPESLLPWCGRVAAGEGARPLGEEDRRAIAAAARDLAGEGLRVLGLACRFLPEVPPLTPASEEEDLVWVGLAGLLDPPRPEAQDAVERCRRAGIRVLMVTGDHPDTALAVAREVGLVAAGGPWPPVLTGSELNALQDEELLARLDSVRIFARVSPEHKLRLVHLLKRRGEVVAMTGDGVNDAPALKRADIGVAMGLSGTEVTKETAALILADDNFATLVAAVEEGRAIYDNIKKYLLYLLSCNFSEVLVLTLAVFLGLPLPLIALQILWVNLTTDGLPALALGVDPKAPDLMDRPPRPPGEGVFTPQIKVLLLAISLHLTLVLLPLFAWYVQTDPNRLGSPELVLRQAQTMVFVTLVLAELLNALNCRDTVHSLLTVGPLANRFLVASLLISLGLLAAVIQWPPLARLFHTLPLDLDDWLLALGLAFTIIPMVELVKWLRRSGRAHP